MRSQRPTTPLILAPSARGEVQLVADGQHLARVVMEGMLRAEVSLDIATADFKAMLIPTRGKAGFARRAPSIVHHLRRLANKGVEIRLLHSGVPSSAVLAELRRELPERIRIRRCPRLHAKAVIIDCAAMYLGSANLTGAGLGAKGDLRRNFEWGVWTQSAALIDSVLESFNAIWEGRHCADCGRRNVCPVPLEEPRI